MGFILHTLTHIQRLGGAYRFGSDRRRRHQKCVKIANIRRITAVLTIFFRTDDIWYRSSWQVEQNIWFVQAGTKHHWFVLAFYCLIIFSVLPCVFPTLSLLPSRLTSLLSSFLFWPTRLPVFFFSPFLFSSSAFFPFLPCPPSHSHLFPVLSHCCLFACPYIRPYVPAVDRCSSVRRVCCCGLDAPQISIDSGGRRAHSSAVFSGKCELSRYDFGGISHNADSL